MDPMPSIIDLDDPDWDPFTTPRDGDVRDPYPKIAQMSREAPVHEVNYRAIFDVVPFTGHSQEKHFSVFGYDPIAKLLLMPEVFSNEAFKETLGKSFGRSISTMDPPEHSRYRRIFQKAFLPQVVAKWGDEVVSPVVDKLMANFAHRGSADLVQEFTVHYPFQVIYAQLGLPPAEAPVFHKLAVAQTLSQVGIEQGFEATEKLGVYFQKLVDYRRKNSDIDIVTHLSSVEVDGEKLPDEIVVSFLRQLVNAGGDTTFRATSILLTGLLRNPDQLAALREDRALLPRAIDEALRWDGPVTNTFRMTTQDTEIEGTKIPAHSVINVVLGSANRDPSKFDNPDQFDIMRPQGKYRHLGFATGPHVCIGQHLARLEMTRAVNAILDGLPNLRLDPDKPEPDIRGCMMRVPEHLHVLFDPA
ncbi:cytochrome P450 [Novosphingobium endophyticum]|uniref:Cytochrome P450 n=1 Tax=Novosphingobium endophyticum TaxID=1955250 RepID=A0A916TUS0_9SPHN|nr:cytochrome P450 [Novosphingobium endophyticum]GGC00753.1 cytochrome P450 [Novosphingobium endophyticum]